MNYLHSLFIYPQILHFLYILAFPLYSGTGEYFIYDLSVWCVCDGWKQCCLTQTCVMEGAVCRCCGVCRVVAGICKNGLPTRNQLRKV